MERTIGALREARLSMERRMTDELNALAKEFGLADVGVYVGVDRMTTISAEMPQLNITVSISCKV